MVRRRVAVAALGVMAALLVGCAGLLKERTPTEEGEGAAPAEAPAAAGKAAATETAPAARNLERIERLPNGLLVIVRERHLGGMAAFRIYAAAGSLNEEEYGGAGVSHLLEHLVSGGTTPTRSEADSRAGLNAIGAQTNAHTSKQFVCYHGEVAGPEIGTLIELIADYTINAQIEPKEFEREFEVVQRELERAESNPMHALWRLADETFFLTHPARFPILGYPETVKRLTREDLVKFYRRAVTPDRAVAVAVGDFDGQEVFARIRDALGKWPRRTGAGPVLPRRVRQVGPRYAEKEMNVAAVRAILEFPSVELTHPDLYPLDILAFILGEGRASRLVSDLREKRGLVQSVSVASYTPAGYDGGRFAVIYQAEPEKAADARQAILEHLARVARDGVKPAEVARAKRQKASEHVFALQTCEAVAADMGTNALLVGDAHFSQRYVENIQKVTAEDVRRVAAEYLRPEVLCESVVRPKRAAAGEAGETKKPEEAAERPGAAAGRPEIIERVLANGTRLLLCPVAGHPTVSIQMFMRGGLSVETPANTGISQFMSRMMLKGTARRKAGDVAAALDAMGAEMNASSGRNTIMLSARCLAEDFEKTFDLAADCLLAPTFPEDEVERVREQLAAELAQMEDTPQGEAGLFFQRSFFADSPYRFPTQGTPDVVKRLTREDLAAWHKQYVAGNNLVVAVFGGIDLVKAAHYAANAVQGLPPNAGLSFPKDVPARKTPAREVYIKPSEKGAAVVYVAYPGMDLYNVRDRFAMDVMDTVMSGFYMPGGWLHEELRGKGLVYEVHAYSMVGLRPGYFAAYAVCQPAKVPEVVGIIEGAMKRATTETFAEAQLGPARATIVTAKESGRETIDGWAFEAALDEALGLGHAFPREEIRRIREVKPEDVSRVAREYLKAPVICVVTSDPQAAEAIRK